MNEQELRRVVENLLNEMINKVGTEEISSKVSSNTGNDLGIDESGIIPDITEIDIKKQLLVDNPHNRAGYLKMKEKTPARIGIGRCGPRYKTITQLRVRADHAAAQDSVFSYVSEALSIHI